MKHTPSHAKSRSTPFGSLRVMILAALLAAISIVCGKYLAIPGGNVMRFSFENLPVLLGGIAFGPLVGAAIGALADLCGSVMVGYEINPIITLGAASIGLISGSLFRITRRLSLSARLLVCVIASHLVGSVVIKTLGLSAFFALPLWELMLLRLVNYLIVGALEYFVLRILLRNHAIRTQLGLHGLN